MYFGGKAKEPLWSGAYGYVHNTTMERQTCKKTTILNKINFLQNKFTREKPINWPTNCKQLEYSLRKFQKWVNCPSQKCKIAKRNSFEKKHCDIEHIFYPSKLKCYTNIVHTFIPFCIAEERPYCDTECGQFSVYTVQSTLVEHTQLYIIQPRPCSCCPSS